MNELPAKVLSSEEREFYSENGYLLLEERVPRDWLQRLRKAADEITKPIDRFLPGEDHAPVHRALYVNPADDHPLLWEFATDSFLTDIVSDLIGPNVKFRKSLLVFQIGEETNFDWHQDTAFNPHTNYDVLIVNIHLYDCGPDTARLFVIPGSHKQGILETVEDELPLIAKVEIENIDVDQQVSLIPPAGSIEIISYRIIHKDYAGGSKDGNYLPLFGYAAADAFPLTPNYPHNSKYSGAIVRGERARYARFDTEPCPIPPPLDEYLRPIPPDKFTPFR